MERVEQNTNLDAGRTLTRHPDRAKRVGGSRLSLNNKLRTPATRFPHSARLRRPAPVGMTGRDEESAE